MTQKVYQIKKIFCGHHKTFLLKKSFKVTLQYLINVFIIFNTVSYIKLIFKKKPILLKTLKKFGKLGINLEKSSDNPVYSSTLFIMIYQVNKL